MGDSRTHGKGSVQGVKEFDALGAVKHTFQRFYGPKGESNQKSGVLSDVTQSTVYDLAVRDEGTLSFALEPDRIASRIDPVTPIVEASMIRALKEKHGNRQKSARVRKLNELVQQDILQSTESVLRFNRTSLLDYIRQDRERTKQLVEQGGFGMGRVSQDKPLQDSTYVESVLRTLGDHILDPTRQKNQALATTESPSQEPQPSDYVFTKSCPYKLVSTQYF